MSEETKDCRTRMCHPHVEVLARRTCARAVQHGWHHGKLAGVVWFGGWLFTMAFAKLLWWQCIVGLVIWPYYLGRLAR